MMMGCNKSMKDEFQEGESEQMFTRTYLYVGEGEVCVCRERERGWKKLETVTLFRLLCPPNK